eukprot:20282_1
MVTLRAISHIRWGTLLLLLLVVSAPYISAEHSHHRSKHHGRNVHKHRYSSASEKHQKSKHLDKNCSSQAYFGGGQKEDKHATPHTWIWSMALTFGSIGLIVGSTSLMKKSDIEVHAPEFLLASVGSMISIICLDLFPHVIASIPKNKCSSRTAAVIFPAITGTVGFIFGVLLLWLHNKFARNSGGRTHFTSSIPKESVDLLEENEHMIDPRMLDGGSAQNIYSPVNSLNSGTNLKKFKSLSVQSLVSAVSDASKYSSEDRCMSALTKLSQRLVDGFLIGAMVLNYGWYEGSMIALSILLHDISDFTGYVGE